MRGVVIPTPLPMLCNAMYNQLMYDISYWLEHCAFPESDEYLNGYIVGQLKKSKLVVVKKFNDHHNPDDNKLLGGLSALSYHEKIMMRDYLEGNLSVPGHKLIILMRKIYGDNKDYTRDARGVITQG